MQRKDPGTPVPGSSASPSDSGSSSSAAINQQYFDAQTSGEFVEGSPHLKHEKLRKLCQELLAKAYEQAKRSANQVSVLDMGAGDGVLSLALLEKGARVTAVDVTESLLEGLAKRAEKHKINLSLHVGDVSEVLENFRKQNVTFDLICCSSFFHHIPDYVELCKRVSDLLPPGGVFFSFQDPLRYDSLSAFT